MPPKKVQITKKVVETKKEADIKVDSTEIEEASTKSTKQIIKKKQPVVEGKEPGTEPVKEPVKEPIKEKEPVAKESTKDEDNNELLLDVSKLSKTTKKHSKKSEQSNESTNELFNEEDVDYRNVLMNYDFTKNRTPPKITKYEKALLIGKRAKQIEEGANPNVKVLPGQSAIEIAEEELRQRKIPLIIKRPLGNTFEYWRPRDMEVIMD